MKTVLVVTTNVQHRALYECGLEGYFRMRFSPEEEGGDGAIDAFIYDVTGPFDEIDRLWLEGTDVPVIVLTSDGRIPLPHSPRRRVLAHPASLDDIFRALQRLGVADRRRLGGPPGTPTRDTECARRPARVRSER